MVRKRGDHIDHIDTPDCSRARAARMARVVMVVTELPDDLTTRDLAELFGVHVRTAERDVAYAELVRVEMAKYRQRWRELLEIKRLAGER